ncbi:MFS transporter [Micromonospora rubida]|uniref:MFS transporter n=1 Tax=Micromonospora rubida TaxID=2697657 RepID=UPI002E2E7429|nr:MFS transporter [Micromonospora rubida]
MPLLNGLPTGVGWRVAFGLGAVLGVAVLLVRRHVPESPRWLFIHGRSEEAERLVDSVEQEVERETGRELDAADSYIEIRQRRSTGFLTIAKTLFARYPKRAVLGFSLFVGQAFLYNAITFGFAQILETFFEVPPGNSGYYFAVIAVGNLLGPLLLLGRLFDTVGRVPMIAGSYIVSGLLLLGTAAGGITGPLLFSKLVGSGQVGDTVLAFVIGASVMIVGGIVELLLGVRAEGKSLEELAMPLSAEEAGVPRQRGSDDAATPAATG